jgi:hypothetical protein
VIGPNISTEGMIVAKVLMSTSAYVLKGILDQILPQDDVHGVSSTIFVLRAIIQLSVVF